MSNAAPEDASMGEDHVHRVAKEFTRLYYRVLNDNPDYLHQFYGQSSCVTVSETQDDGVNYTVCADTLEQIKALTLRMFEEVRVTLTNCTPQNSLGGSIQLMVSGVMHQKNCDEERLFTQAMLLAKQEQGYYVLNDTVHVHSRTSSWKVLKFREVQENASTQHEAVPDAKGTVTEPTETEVMKDEKEEMEEEPQQQNVAPPQPLVQVPVAEAAPVESAPVAESVVTPELQTAPSPPPQERVFEEEPVAPPQPQAVTPIEKPLQPAAPVQMTHPPSVPAPSVRRSYRDALKASRLPTEPAK